MLKHKKHLVDHGCLQLRDILKQDYTFLKHHQFNTLYQSKLNFLEYGQLLGSVPGKWKSMLTAQNELPQRKISVVDKIKSTDKISKFVYPHLISTLPRRTVHEEKWCDSIQEDFDTSIWAKIYNSAFETTIDSKFRSFQYKIITRTLVTNKSLYTWKIKNSSNCTFCLVEEETILHLFVDCGMVRSLWYELYEWLLPDLDIFEVINKRHIIFGTLDNFVDANTINSIILIVKRYIYVQRCYKAPVSLTTLLHFVRKFINMEISVKNSNIKSKCETKWSKIGHKFLV